MNTSHKLTHTLHSEAGAYPSGIHLNPRNPPPLNSLAAGSQRLLPRLCGLVRWAVALGVLALLLAPLTAWAQTVNLPPIFVQTLGNGTDGEVIAFHPGDGMIYHASNQVFEKINPQTNAITPISANLGTHEIFGLVWYPPLNVFLATDIDSDLNHITTAGVVTTVGNNGIDMRGLAVVGTRVFAVGAFDGNLYEINPANGAILSTTPMTLNGQLVTRAQSITTDPVTGQVYVLVTRPGQGAQTRALGLLNVATGAATKLVDLPDAFSSITFVNFGNSDLYGVTGDGATVPETLYRFTISNRQPPPPPTGRITDPVVCTGPNGTAAGTIQITNAAAVAQAFTLNTTFTNFTGVPGSCTLTGAQPGAVCNVAANGLTANGTIPANTVLTVQYQANVVSGATVTATSDSTLSGAALPQLVVTATVNCPASASNALVSDQSPGSVLIYNIYTSSGTGQTTQNSRINITNTSTTSGIYVHLFFVDGSTCSIADSYLCLTANQTSSFLASDIDPGVTGYLVAVAVNSDGCPVNFNHLIGDLYAKFASGHAANLGAEALPALWGFFFNSAGQATDRNGNLCQINGAANPAANAADCGNNANPVRFFAGNLPVLPGCTANSDTALLNFNGLTAPSASPGYSKLPRALAVDNLPSRLDGNDTLLIVNRLGGSLLTGAATIGTIFGIFYDDAENALSYSFQDNVL